MLKISVLTALAAMLASSAPIEAATAKKCLGVPRAKVAAQLYTMASLPASTEAPADKLAMAFNGLRSAGFERIEAAGGTFGLPAERYDIIALDTGVRIIGSHENLDEKSWATTLDQAQARGQRFIGSGNYGQPGFATLADTLATAANLNTLGQMAAAKGLWLYIHNHDGEFATRHAYDVDKDGKTELLSVWEIIEAETDPRYVSFQVDVHWARVGLGLDKFDSLLDLLKRHRGRIISLHMKDTSADGKITDLGRGTTDWPQVVSAAGRKIAFYVWEYDNPPDPIASARIGYAFLTCAE